MIDTPMPEEWTSRALAYVLFSGAKMLTRFTAAEGVGDHCEMQARTLFHQRSFD